MRINTNMMSLNTHRQLTMAQGRSASSMEKLSSGFRINRAGDDAAGLAISEKMRGQIRGLRQAGRNAQDGISLIQTAEGALTETHAALQRMREIAIQAASDTNTADDRIALQAEVDQLSAEISRIADTTEFNTQKLLDGNYEAKIHIGANAGQNVDIVLSNMDAETLAVAGDGGANFQVQTADVASAGSLTALDNLAIVSGSQTYDVIELDSQVMVSGEYAANYALYDSEDGKVVAISKDGTEYHMLEAMSDVEDLGTTASVQTTGGLVTITFEDAITSGEVSFEAAVTSGGGNGIDITEITATPSFEAEGLETGTYTINTENFSTIDNLTEIAGDDFAMNTAGGAGSAQFDFVEAVMLNDDDEVVAIAFGLNAAGDTIIQPEDNNTSADHYAWFSVSDLDMEAQGNTLSDYGVSSEDALFTQNSHFSGQNNAEIADGTEVTIKGEGGIDITTRDAANDAIAVIDAAINQVSEERSLLGAVQNRLDYSIRNLNAAAENMQAAESRIRDVDMANEMVEFTKQNILMQASTAMLAQANMAPQTVLQLLG